MDNAASSPEKWHHRSKERIRNLGEVFTPESYVQDMLNLLSQNKESFWSDENVILFEPSAGHGNIVLPIYKRRIEGFYQRAVLKNLPEAPDYAVANALNTLWAIDIDKKNIESCRSRLFLATVDFLKEKLKIEWTQDLFIKKESFLSHVITALQWHVHENEALSALSSSPSAKSAALLTKSGQKWFRKNGHHPLNFHLTWVSFYKDCERKNVIPLEYVKAKEFLKALLQKNSEEDIPSPSKEFPDFKFVWSILRHPSEEKAA